VELTYKVNSFLCKIIPKFPSLLIFPFLGFGMLKLEEEGLEVMHFDPNPTPSPPSPQTPYYCS
jgi:hypothetical protein